MLICGENTGQLEVARIIISGHPEIFNSQQFKSTGSVAYNFTKAHQSSKHIEQVKLIYLNVVEHRKLVFEVLQTEQTLIQRV